MFTRELIPHLEPLSPPEIQDGLFFMESIGLEAFINMSAFRTAYKEYNSSVSKMNDSTDAAASGITGKFQSMGNSVLGVAKGLGTAMVAGATAAMGAITAFVGSGVKLATDLEAQMAGVRAILGITADDLELIRQKTIDLGLNPNLKVSAVEAAGAIEMLARNGLGMQEILDGAAESTILLANATGAEFSNAANIATDAMAIFNIGASDMLAAVDGISAVTVNSKFDINDYANALAQGGGAASVAGVEFNDFNAAIAAMSPLFKAGSDAGTSFKTFLQRTVPQSAQAAEAIEALGLEFFDANGNMRSMADIAGQLNEAMYGTSTAMTEVGGRTAEQNAELQRLGRIYDSTLQTIADYEAGIKGAGLSEAARADKLEDLRLQLGNTEAAMQPLLSIQGEMVATTRQLTEAERLQYLTTIFGADAMRAAAGLAGFTEEEFAALQATMGETSALDQARIRVDTLAGAMDIFAGIIEALKLQVGDAFIPLIRQVVESLSTFVEANQEKIVGFFQGIATFISTLVSTLQSGSGPIEAFLSALSAAGVSDGIVAQIGNFADRARDLINTVREFVTEHAEAFKGALLAIGAVLAAAAIAAAITGIVAAIGSFATGIGPIILLVGLLGAVVAENWDTIQAAILSAWAAIKPTFDAFMSVLNALWGEIKPGVKILGQFASQIVEAFRGGGVKAAIQEFVNLWPAIQTVITATITKVLSFLGSKFGVDLVGIFNNVRAVLQTAWTVISGVITSVVETLRPSVQGLIDGFSSTFSSFLPLGESFRSLWESLKPVVSTVAAVIGAVLLALVGVVVGVFNGIVQAIQPLITTLGFVLNGIVTFVDGAIQFFTGFFNLIVGLFTGNTEKMKEAWQQMGQGITNVVLGLVEAVVGLYTGFRTTLLTLISGIVEGVIGFFQNLYDTLVGHSIIPDLVNAIVEWITGLKDKFVQLIITLVTNVVNKFIELKDGAIERIQALRDSAVSLFDALKTAVSNKIELLKIAATNKFNLIKTAVIDKLTELKNDAVAKALEIKDSVVAKFEELKTSLMNKVEAFKSIGSNLIIGIKDGIMSQVANLMSAVEGLIAMLPQAVKDLLGIASPSKLFYSFGVNVIRGLINGVLFMRSAATAAMRNVVGSLPGVDLNVSASNLARGSSNAGVAAARPSVVQLDPSSLRGLGGGETNHNYYLTNHSGGSQLGIRQAFRLMELSRA